MSVPSRASHLQVRRSPIHGKGLFTARAVAAGELIGVYEGKPVQEDGMHVLWVEHEYGQWTGYEGTNCLRFLNHCSDPNAEMDGLICFARRDISADEEITIDYGWDDA